MKFLVLIKSKSASLFILLSFVCVFEASSLTSGKRTLPISSRNPRQTQEEWKMGFLKLAEESNQKTRLLYNSGAFYARLGYPKMAIAMYEKCVSYGKGTLIQPPISMQERNFSSSSGDYQEYIRKKCLQIKERQYGKEHPMYTRLLNSINTL